MIPTKPYAATDLGVFRFLDGTLLVLDGLLLTVGGPAQVDQCGVREENGSSV